MSPGDHGRLGANFENNKYSLGCASDDWLTVADECLVYLLTFRLILTLSNFQWKYAPFFFNNIFVFQLGIFHHQLAVAHAYASNIRLHKCHALGNIQEIIWYISRPHYQGDAFSMRFLYHFTYSNSKTRWPAQSEIWICSSISSKKINNN